jgi:hypothetical protein
MKTPRRRIPARLMVVPLVLLLSLMACDIASLPSGGDVPTPCPGNCPPPERGNTKPHTFTGSRFRLTYFDPWSVDSSNAQQVILVAQTDLGEISVQMGSKSVSPGTTAAQVLSSTAGRVRNSDQFSDVQDAGPILGAEIGYVAGAGEAYQAEANAPNAPSTPVYIEIMASVQGDTSMVLIALSPLDPLSQDPSVIPSQSYDLLVNSVEWI